MSIHLPARAPASLARVAILLLAAALPGMVGCDRVASPLSESNAPSTDDPVPVSEFENFIAAKVEVGDDDAARAEDNFQPSKLTIESETDRAASLRGGIQSIDGPTVITKPGVYVVTTDFSVSEKTGDAIVIQSNFVWLDLGGHEISGPGNKIGRGIVLDDVRFVFVANGTLETFGIGVALLESRRCAVVLTEIEGGDEMAAPPEIPPQIGFLLVNSARNAIRWNDVDQTNLGFFVRGGGSHDNLISRNEAVAGDHGLLGVCYNPAEGQGPAGPTDDLVKRNRLSRFNVGIQTSSGSMHNRFERNLIEYFEAPWVDFNGTNEFVDNTTIQLTR